MQFNAGRTSVGWAVRCSACGSCCNSAPVLSLPELFCHQHLFVGTLGIRRVRQVRTGESLGQGSDCCQANQEDRAAYDQISADCLHRIRAEEAHGHDFLLTPQGFDDPGLGRCPALGEDGRCTIHGKGKPALCSAIPLDPLMPDRLQHLVLAERWAESDELGARCITRTKDPERTTVRGTRVRDDDALRALAAGRRALAADKRFWGTAIFAQIAEQLLAQSGGVQRIPRQGFLVIPLTPVIELLAGVSERCRELCLEYLDAQMVLCAITARACLARKQPSDATTLDRLQGLLRANHRLRSSLTSGRPESHVPPGVAGSDVEAWLEHAPAEVVSRSPQG